MTAYRRDFLLGLVAAAAWPALGWTGLTYAQPAKAPTKPLRVGVLAGGRPAGSKIEWHAFVDTMRELGWIEGRNIVYETVYMESDLARLPALAKELIAKAPDLIHVVSGTAAEAVHGHTRTIPIVAAALANPERSGLVESLARPGGNLTGVATIASELGGKRMQLAQEVLPKAGRIGVLLTDGRNSLDELKLIEQAARPGTLITRGAAADRNAFDAAFRGLVESRTEVLLVTHRTLFMNGRKPLLALAAKHRIPVIGFRSEFADDGALMSYSSNLLEQIRRSAHLADKVLKGTKPAVIPVEHPTKFELVVNLKTAKALGITIPQSLLLQATRVIE